MRRSTTNGATWLVDELGARQSVRRITLPRTAAVDTATTRSEAGVLTLTLPKTAGARPRQIEVVATPQLGAGNGRSS